MHATPTYQVHFLIKIKLTQIQLAFRPDICWMSVCVSVCVSPLFFWCLSSGSLKRIQAHWQTESIWLIEMLHFSATNNSICQQQESAIKCAVKEITTTNADRTHRSAHTHTQQQHPPKCQSNLKFIYSLYSALLCSAPFRLERDQVCMACTFSSHVSHVKHKRNHHHQHHHHHLLLLPLHLTHKSRLSSCTRCELFKYIHAVDDHCEFSTFIHLPAL